jgi:NADH-quinone oxidoreductase subunit L
VLLTIALVCLFAPLVGFVVQYALGRRLPRQGDLWTVGTIGLSLVCAVAIFVAVMRGAAGDGFLRSWPWFDPDGSGTGWTVDVFIDGLTAVMLVVVTLVAFLVHVFSMGYMHGDPKYWLFFAWLQMFSVSMLMLVLAGNLLHLFIGWELVGLCSYKLIGFWSERPDPANAARKAFITTRIGDLGMLVALMAIYAAVGSFGFEEIRLAVHRGALSDPWLTVAGLGLFLAAAGKSAQMPLHVWLPDAMEGPTPVSALIHAATMVAAGVYLIGRMFFMLTPEVLFVIAVIGTVTALMAGLIALAQDDIKKVLAYSTVSQLGYMFLGLGVGAWHAALFHLTTHAFFKALMFLGSGSVIHACHHEQDMRKMGGLWKKLPVTGTTFLIGVLAIAGLPFLSGFYSKDAILAGAWHRFPVLFWLALGAAVLTAFYMTRLFVMTFLGEPRDHHVHDHAHEGPPTLQMPLVVLAALSIVAGWGVWHETMLAPPTDVAVGAPTVADLHAEHSGTVAAMAIVAGLAGLGLGFFVFHVLSAKVGRLKRPFAPLERAFAHKFWFDELYRKAILAPAYRFARACGWIDAKGVDGLVNAVGAGSKSASRASGRADVRVVDGAVEGIGAAALAGGAIVTRAQNGRIRSYLAFSVGAVAFVLILVRLLD